MSTPQSGAVKNMIAAQGAVRYVKEKLPTGAQNKLGDVLSSGGGSFTCVIGMKVAFSLVLSNQSTEQRISTIATTAERRGCGNCGEQSSVAFVHLDGQGVRPLELMQFSNVDHGFVVIGRTAGSDVKNPGAWGADAVVCDPWLKDGMAYPAAELRKHWPDGIPELIFARA